MSTPIPRGSRSRVYRRIVDQLQTDPVLQRVVKTWTTWTGRDVDNVRSNASTEIHVTVTPQLSGMAIDSPDSHVGWLSIQVFVYPLGSKTGTATADECLDLVELIEEALSPPGDDAKRMAFQRSLVDLGATTGLIHFTQPPNMAYSAENTLVCAGSMRIEVRRMLNP